MTVTIKRDALYEAIWTEPATKVAARYGISSVALAKICRKLHVPTPPRGYWAKRAAGHEIARERLPTATPDQVVTYKLRQSVGAPRVLTSVDLERQRQRIEVPAEASALHPLLAKYEARLRKRGEQTDIWARSACVAIRVSRAQLDRALRIMNALFFALDERGIAIEITAPITDAGRSPMPSATVVTVQAIRLRIKLSEDRRQESPVLPPEVPRRPEPSIDHESRVQGWTDRLTAKAERARLRYAHPPAEVWSGELRLAIIVDGYHRWSAQRQVRDLAGKPLEERLSLFVRQLYRVADHVREQAAQDELARLEFDARQRAWKEQERAKQRCKTLTEDLARRVDSLQYASEIRALTARVESGGAQSASENAWIAWARVFADRVERSALEVAEVWKSA